MKISLLAAVPTTFAALSASAMPLQRAPNSSLHWAPCETQGNQTVPVTCASLAVPRDYTASNASDTINLNLVRLAATKQPFKGSVLFNPGGPGINARNDFVRLHRVIQMIVGSSHDIITWDPRGTGVTIPYTCFSSTATGTASRQDYNAGYVTSANASDVAIGAAWAVGGTLADACAETMADNGSLVGTAFTVRDMMQIVDALGEDGMLRFYGQSYGTALGATAAAMFPDRVDKVALDGVLNPTEYWSGRDVQQLAASDATFDGFLQQCLASPSLCSLAKLERPGSTLRQQVDEALEVIKYNPLVVGPDALTGIIDYGQVKSLIGSLLYGPSTEWELLALSLEVVITRNLTLYEDYAAQTVQGSNQTTPDPFPDGPGTQAERTQGIRCSDNTLRADSWQEVLPLVRDFSDTSRITGDWVAVPQPLTCPQWKLAAKERYTGGFNNIKTRKPVLVVGNTFDPITSLAAARNASGSFVNSRLLVHNGYGHTSASQPSLCTAKAVQAYFDDGVLPASGAVCDPSVPLFTKTDPFGINGMAKKRDADDNEDAMMLDALLDWGRARSQWHRKLM